MLKLVLLFAFPWVFEINPTINQGLVRVSQQGAASPVVVRTGAPACTAFAGGNDPDRIANAIQDAWGLPGPTFAVVTGTYGHTFEARRTAPWSTAVWVRSYLAPVGAAACWSLLYEDEWTGVVNALTDSVEN
jgi:hypothetical protein